MKEGVDQLSALLESVMLLGQLAQDIAVVKADIKQVMAPLTGLLASRLLHRAVSYELRQYEANNRGVIRYQAALIKTRAVRESASKRSVISFAAKMPVQ